MEKECCHPVDSRERCLMYSTTDGRHAAGRLLEITLTDAMPRLLVPGGIDDERPEMLHGNASAQQRFEIPFVMTEETGANPSFSSDPESIAGTTERPADRGDETDASGLSIRKGPVVRGGMWIAVIRAGQGPDRIDLPSDLLCSDDLSTIPVACGIERHELDESDVQVVLTRGGGEIDDLIVIDMPHHHDIHLGTGKAG